MCVRATSHRRLRGEHAPCRQHGGEPGDDHPLEIELARDIGDVQRGGAAEREDGEAPRIDAAAHRYQPDAFGHVRVDDAVDALGRGHAIDAEPAGDAIDGDLGGDAIEARATAEKVVGIEEAEDEVGVRHRRFDAAAAIAGRSRLRAGALGPDVQQAAVVDARDRAAAGADAGDVQALQRHALAGDAPVRRDGRLAADHERDVRRGAAHVERE